jgi:hypothetical protein
VLGNLRGKPLKLHLKFHARVIQLHPKLLNLIAKLASAPTSEVLNVFDSAQVI